jgi:hypothetical protein
MINRWLEHHHDHGFDMGMDAKVGFVYEAKVNVRLAPMINP